MKPAAVLIAAFEIEIGGRAQVGALLEHGRVAHPGIEPYVEDVLLFAKLSVATFFAPRLGGQQLLRRTVEPRIRSFPLEEVRDVVGDPPGGQRLAAPRAKKRDD